MQHAGDMWKGNYGMRYHLYPIPDNLGLNDTVALVYEYWMERQVRNNRDGLLRSVGLLYMADEKNDAGNNVSKKRLLRRRRKTATK